MAKVKTWTPEDREAALGWIERKAKTGAVFVGQDETAENMLPKLASITELSDFAEAVQAALTQAAWKRLLGALRQRKHQDQDDDEGKADAGTQQADDAGACQSCARLKAQVLNLEAELATARMSSGSSTEVESLQQQLASEAKLLAEHMQPIRRANDGDPTALVDWLRQHLFPGSTWHRFASAINADNGTQKDDGHQPVDQGHQPADEDGHQVQAALSVQQVAALALARSYMAAGKTLDSAARAASGKLRNALGCRLGEGGDIAVAPVHRLLKASEGQAITPASKAVRDEVIIILVKAGVQYKPLARALGISDGTVRNVIKRHQHQAEAA